MFRRGFLLLISFLLLWTSGVLAEEEMTIQYFYMNDCEQCDIEGEFISLFYQIAGFAPSDVHVQYHNVLWQAGRKAYDAATKDLSDNDRRLPLLMVNGQAYAGDVAINDALNLHFGQIENSEVSLIWLVEATACENCIQAKLLTSMLPTVVPVTIDGELMTSQVEVRVVNMAEDPSLAAALYDCYQVPDEQRIAPCVFLGDTYLSGLDSIRKNLNDLVRDGSAMHTFVPQATPLQQEEPLSIWMAIGAGLAAGLNPCAMSMLLFFLGLLLSMKRSPLMPGLTYLAGKLIVYLLISFAFSQFWSRYAPEWFPMAVRIVLTVVTALLILLNLSDAYHARSGKLEAVRNQLPQGLRGSLHRLIRRSTQSRGGWLIPTALALGAAVAAGEFLCAGQMYLAVMISQSQQGASVWPLISYSLAFLLPSVLVVAVVCVSRKTLASSDWILRHLSGIKLISAAVMLLSILYAWFA